MTSSRASALHRAELTRRRNNYRALRCECERRLTRAEKNGCVAVQLKPEEVEQVFAEARDLKTVEIDLPKQVVRLSSGKEFSFTIDEFRKRAFASLA